MTKQESSSYESTEVLRNIIKNLAGRKFKLDCGHHVTIGHTLGNDITIYTSYKTMRIICSQCGY